MAKSPARNRTVYFLGAGFSRAFHLPNTAELLTAVHALSSENAHWGVSRNITSRLKEAYRYFYPARGAHFTPPVGDFFTVLTTYQEVAGSGLPQGFSDTELLGDLKFALASILCARVKEIDERLANPHPFLDRALVPGTVIVTSNWDHLIERACLRRGLPYRLRWYGDESSITLLKLHGSVDWTTKVQAKQPWGTKTYYRLEDLVRGDGGKHRQPTANIIARCHAAENWRRGYQRIKAATQQPFMVTMARGKTDTLRPLREIWTDAYHVLSRASELHIVGYSLPDDDTEIRTLLRAGVCRGSADPAVYALNPSPDVHVRIQQQIVRELRSDYATVPHLV